MSRYEILSPEGLRVDGRRWNEIRRFHAQLSTQSAAADGSSYVEQGNTKIICTVTGPAEASMRSKQLHDKATVTVEVTFAAFSGTERKRRGKNDKRVQEMRTMLQRTFASAILTHLHPRSEITISLHILTQDGGVLATCVNAITLALIDAGVPMTDYVVGMTAGVTMGGGGEPLLDVNGIEDSDLPTLTVATLGATENISLLQLENKVHMTLVESMLAAAIDGCAKMKEMLDEVVRKHGEEVARSGTL
ncbi:ribosomal protein S5 domain 2-type protein [Trichophaea hybrida]|nr:ribosomal protein S5 domain 2-type protein [Trichophaea hybrida]